MSDVAPQWARELMAGQIQWTLELEPQIKCGIPVLKGKWYPGAIKFIEEFDEENHIVRKEATNDGKGEPIEVEFRRAPVARSFLFAKGVFRDYLVDKFWGNAPLFIGVAFTEPNPAAEYPVSIKIGEEQLSLVAKPANDDHKYFQTETFAVVLPGPGLGEADPGAPPLTDPVPRYRKTSKWDVRYHDLQLGQVEGTAWCNWKADRCSVGLRHPTTNEISWMRTEDLEQTVWSSPLTSPIRLRLSGNSPEREKVTAPPLPAAKLDARDGDTVQIVLGAGGPGLVTESYARMRAAADLDVTLDLVPNKEGALIGRWSYLADPITERSHSKGAYGGRVGIFEPVGEEALTRFIRNRLHQGNNDYDPGGFLALQHGAEEWLPRPPHVYGAFVLEDEAAFSGGKPTHPHPHGAYGAIRHIVVIGRDLPIEGSRVLAEVETKDEGFQYNIAAVEGGDRVSEEQKQNFERAWNTLTRDMSSDEAAAFRKLDAVIVFVTANNAEPGKKTFSWGGVDIPWELQYGDNTADVRLARRLTETETEPIDQLALPEEVFVEVETGTKIEADVIPLQLGGTGVAAAPIEIAATRVAAKGKLYRSPPFLVAAPEDMARLAAGGKVVVPILKGRRLAATVNRDRVQFLRVSSAVALASEPSSLWINALRRASACNRTDFVERDWPRFAKQSAEHFSKYNTSTDILYGDHAAMLIRRDAFLGVMRHQADELAAAIKDDGLVDAWYRSMHDAVTEISGYPLADAEVTGPSGKVKFSEAYSEEFKESNFQPSKTADGMERYLKWRRAATREAMAFFGQKMDGALKVAENVEDCSREDLLKLTGSGFRNIVPKIVPLLMRRREGTDVAEPDWNARIYARNVEGVAEGVKAVKDYGAQVNTAVITAALILIPPAAEVAWTGAGIGGGQGIGILTGIIGGFAVFGHDSAYQIYQTYKEHEDVRFAFGSTAALGLERYFSDEAKKTEWWQTGALIFGQAVMQGVLTKAAIKPVSEGIAAWRGSRIVANFGEVGARSIYRGNVPEASVEAMRSLSLDDQFAVGMFILKEEEQLNRLGIVGEAREYTHQLFRALGVQADGKALQAELPSIVRAIEAQSLLAGDDLKTAKPLVDGLREAKNKIAAFGMVAAEREAMAGNEPLLALETNAATRLADEVVPPGMPWRINDQGRVVADGPVGGVARLAEVRTPWPDTARLPKPGVPWETTIDGKKVTFEIESFLNQGSFSMVYKLKSIPKELEAAVAKDGIAGKPLVLKIIKTSEEIEAQAPNVWPEESTTNILPRMIKGRNLLRRGNIPQVEFTAFETANILLQEFVPFEEGKFPRPAATDLADGLARYRVRIGVERQRAIAELFNQLGDAEIAALDMHGGNIYLEKSGNGYIAKIIDQDFICTFSDVNNGVCGEMLSPLKVMNGKRAQSVDFAKAFNLADPAYSNPRSLMQKIMEHHGWLRFDGNIESGTGSYVPWMLDPLEVKKVMPDLRYVPIPPPPPGFAPPAVKGGWLQEPFKNLPARTFANDNSEERRRRSLWVLTGSAPRATAA